MITKASVASFDGLFRSSEYSIHIAGISILVANSTPDMYGTWKSDL